MKPDSNLVAFEALGQAGCWVLRDDIPTAKLFRHCRRQVQCGAVNSIAIWDLGWAYAAVQTIGPHCTEADLVAHGARVEDSFMRDCGEGLVRMHQRDALPQKHLPQQRKAAEQRRRRRLRGQRLPGRIVHLPHIAIA